MVGDALKMPSSYIRPIRERLWRQDPHCHWCGIWTQLHRSQYGDRPPHNAATLDHYRSKLDPLRNRVATEPRWVLACFKCNQQRGQRDSRQFSGVNVNDPQPLRVPLGELRPQQAEYTALLREITERLRSENEEALG